MFGCAAILFWLLVYNLTYRFGLGEIPAKLWFILGGGWFAALVAVAGFIPETVLQHPWTEAVFEGYCILFFMFWTFGFAKRRKEKRACHANRPATTAPTRYWLWAFLGLLCCGGGFMAYAELTQSTNPMLKTGFVFCGTLSSFVLIGLVISWRRHITPILQESFKKPEPPAVLRVKLLDGYAQEVRGGFWGSVLGGLMGGSRGRTVGFFMPLGTKYIQRFGVLYSDNTYAIEEVEEGSKRYRELMRYVSWSDL